MGRRPQRLLSRELPLPAEVLLQLAEHQPERYPVLFDSASASGPRSRYSLLVATSGDAIWKGRDGRLAGIGDGTRHACDSSGFLEALDRWWHATAAPTALDAGNLPWCGGFAVFLGYELATEIEPALRLPAAELPMGAFALRVPAALVFDHERGALSVLAEPDEGGAAALERLVSDAQACTAPGSEGDALHSILLELREDDPAEFLARVAAVQESIRAGDLYQANLSRGWQARLRPGVSSASIYRRLRAANPAPFAVWSQWGGMQVLSSSPERLVSLSQGRVSTRPIAGTRPRVPPAAGDTAQSTDRKSTAALVAHPKERAEHVMLIDLERNDLGRICAPGSVEVRDFMSVESYAHVHHLVSEVTGRLRADVTPVQTLRAVFPGGTITGCPKVRCMQIIGELEQRGRGAYTGSLGILGLDGSADFNILIRTLTRVGDQLELRAGAGIVADSVATRELEETRAKARGVLAALGVAA